MHIKIKKGLDLPIQGRAKGPIRDLPLPQIAALDLAPFANSRFVLRKKEGEHVKIGEVLVEDKSHGGSLFASPVSGHIKEVVRGLKRRILQIVIETDGEQSYLQKEPINLGNVTDEQLMQVLRDGGIFPLIRVRPCLRLPHLQERPRAIFIKALDSSPLTPPPELEVQGFEEEFQLGLKALSQLAPVHLVYDYLTQSEAFLKAQYVECHTAEGPHPVGNPSVHIERIAPIHHRDDVIWTLDVRAAIAVGMMLSKGRYHNQKVVSIAGEGILSEERGFYRVYQGCSIAEILNQRLGRGSYRLITGDPLNGSQVKLDSFVGFFDRVVCAIPEALEKREMLHFMKPVRRGFSFSRAYIASSKHSVFTTHQHGERRAFVVSGIYDKVMPMNLSVIYLVKALIAEDFERAEKLGLLEIAPEDFALPAFVCPSKIEMVDIVRQALSEYVKEYYPER